MTARKSQIFSCKIQCKNLAEKSLPFCAGCMRKKEENRIDKWGALWFNDTNLIPKTKMENLPREDAAQRAGGWCKPERGCGVIWFLS